ncbi:hypothetical protein BS47DRAFT_1365102 [Hydnum rufescens UP504]|uniref:Uncharacterized protein n=1 Tax=Hydnum rufescens UP504 TaxID=1448309 RepID=A0A9P6ARN5_9AGAM|nr:hypothetical protein BS47DRAFT_1365102 [Hydnum rufescens UP504]
MYPHPPNPMGPPPTHGSGLRMRRNWRRHHRGRKAVPNVETGQRRWRYLTRQNLVPNLPVSEPSPSVQLYGPIDLKATEYNQLCPIDMALLEQLQQQSDQEYDPQKRRSLSGSSGRRTISPHPQQTTLIAQVASQCGSLAVIANLEKWQHYCMTGPIRFHHFTRYAHIGSRTVILTQQKTRRTKPLHGFPPTWVLEGLKVRYSSQRGLSFLTTMTVLLGVSMLTGFYVLYEEIHALCLPRRTCLATSGFAAIVHAHIAKYQPALADPYRHYMGHDAYQLYITRAEHAGLHGAHGPWMEDRHNLGGPAPLALPLLLVPPVINLSSKLSNNNEEGSLLVFSAVNPTVLYQISLSRVLQRLIATAVCFVNKAPQTETGVAVFDEAPKMCYNFLMLARQRKSDNRSCHRVMPGFMIPILYHTSCNKVLGWEACKRKHRFHSALAFGTPLSSAITPASGIGMPSKKRDNANRFGIKLGKEEENRSTAVVSDGEGEGKNLNLGSGAGCKDVYNIMLWVCS